MPPRIGHSVVVYSIETAPRPPFHLGIEPCNLPIDHRPRLIMSVSRVGFCSLLTLHGRSKLSSNASSHTELKFMDNPRLLSTSTAALEQKSILI